MPLKNHGKYEFKVKRVLFKFDSLHFMQGLLCGRHWLTFESEKTR